MSNMVDDLGGTEQGSTEPAAEESTTEVNEQGVEVEGQGTESTEEASEGGAPEQYEDFQVGEDVAINEEVLSEFKDSAKDMGLSQENAQKLVDMAQKVAEQQAVQTQEKWAEVREGWVGEIKADREFGGDHFDTTLERANRALRQYGDDGLIKFLGDTGYGDNPALIKLLARVDKATGEDHAGQGKPTAPEAKTAAEVLYGNSHPLK